MLKKLRERLFGKGNKHDLEKNICKLLLEDPLGWEEGFSEHSYEHIESGIRLWTGANTYLCSPAHVFFGLYYTLKIESLVRKSKRLKAEIRLKDVNVKHS